MADDIKKFETTYKKCSADFKDCTMENYTKLVKRIKYFRYDAYQGFSQLAEEVAGLKSDHVEGKKIEDFAKESKTINDVLKGIKWNQGKQSDAAKELQDLQKVGTDSETTLKKLQKDIADYVKKSGKGAKPNPDIQKLEKQIESDLKDLKTFYQKFKLIPQDHLENSKVFDAEITKVLNVKPAPSKFHKATDSKLDKAALKKKIIACGKDQKAVDLWSNSAEKFAKQGDEESAEKCISKAQDILKNMQDVQQEYAEIKKKWKSQIELSTNKKDILAAIDFFEKRINASEKRVADAGDEIKKLLKKASG